MLNRTIPLRRFQQRWWKKVTAIAKMEDTAAYRQMVDELLKEP